jgi:hypothetical protein
VKGLGLALFALLFSPTLGAVNFTLVQSTYETSTHGTHSTAPFASPNVAGNAIVVFIAGCCGGNSLTGDSAGNTYVNLGGGVYAALRIKAATGNYVTGVSDSIVAIEYHSATLPFYGCPGGTLGVGTAFSGAAFRSTSEALALLSMYNYGTGGGYPTATLASGTVRGSFDESGSEGWLAGDDDRGSVTAIYSNTATVAGGTGVAFLALDGTSSGCVTSGGGSGTHTFPIVY